MHLIITDAWLAKSRAVHLSGLQLVTAFLVGALIVMLLALSLYHWVFLKGAREGWPVVGTLVKLVTKDEFDQRERFLRENLDVMARRMGEMQAKLTQLESLGTRVASLAGINPAELQAQAGSGGVQIGAHALTLSEIQLTLDELEHVTHQRTDLLTIIESRLFDRKMKSLMIPTQKPVALAELGSAFGWRIDPFSGRSALHTGLDFPATVGTPILAAAGGVVVVQEFHAEYGNMTEIDHGNGLVTRYAHASKTFVKVGDLIKRGQKIAEVGTTGRSTGTHLHFEVMVNGVFQDPQKFLSGRPNPQSSQLAQTAKSASTTGANQVH